MSRKRIPKVAAVCGDDKAKVIEGVRWELQALGLRPYSARLLLALLCAGSGSSAELAELVLDEVGVAVVPGEAFGTPGYFRLSYALGDADLEKGLTRLADLLGEAR